MIFLIGAVGRSLVYLYKGIAVHCVAAVPLLFLEPVKCWKAMLYLGLTWLLYDFNLIFDKQLNSSKPRVNSGRMIKDT